MKITLPWAIAHYSTYFVWFKLAWMEFLRELGCSFMERGRDGVSFLVTEATCRYHALARSQDLIVGNVGKVQNHTSTLVGEV